MPEPPLYYGDYLQLEQLLSAQKLASESQGHAVHDEMLFIVVHQTYELWFKQILWELDDLLRIFGKDQVDETDMGTAHGRLRRIVEIETVLIQQIDVLETMTPLDFLDFRDLLFPASGFQSVQFRMVENKLGMRREDRLLLAGAPYTARFSWTDRESVEQIESGPSLFDLVEQWLERTPFLESGGFQFREAFKDAVRSRLEADREVVATNPNLTDGERAAQLEDFTQTMEQYEALFDEERHKEQQSAGRRRLSHRAFQAAIFINMYRDQPALHAPYQILASLMDIDEGFTAWRYRHAQMALRLIGRRIGTGGSAGARYLEKSAERSRVFSDLFDLSTFLIPRDRRPPLPPDIVEAMRFRYQG